MKTLFIIVVLLFAMGCTPKFVIPEEPKYRDIGVYPYRGLVCFDEKGWGDLGYNIQTQLKYAEKLRQILEGLKK